MGYFILACLLSLACGVFGGMAVKSVEVSVAILCGIDAFGAIIVWATGEIVGAIEAQHKQSVGTEAYGHVCKESPLAGETKKVVALNKNEK